MVTSGIINHINPVTYRVTYIHRGKLMYVSEKLKTFHVPVILWGDKVEYLATLNLSDETSTFGNKDEDSRQIHRRHFA